MAFSDDDERKGNPGLNSAFSLNLSKYNNKSNNKNARPTQNGSKKRSRNGPLSSLSANTRLKRRVRRVPRIPIPSFKMTPSSQSTAGNDPLDKTATIMDKLSRLERAFFDEDEDEIGSNSDRDETKNEGGNEHKKKLFKTKPVKKNSRIHKNNQKKLSMVAEQCGSNTDETESENSDFEEELIHSKPDPQRTTLNISQRNRSQESQAKEAAEKTTTTEGTIRALTTRSVDEKEKSNDLASLPSSTRTKEAEETTTTIVGNIRVPEVGSVYEKEESNDNLLSLSSSLAGSENRERRVLGSKKCQPGSEPQAEDHDGSNDFDFGDGGCDIDDIPRDNDYSEEPCMYAPGNENGESASPSKPTTCRPQQALARRKAILLEREIDRLFLRTDTNTITMKIFCKTLGQRMDEPLDKATKKKVKARVLSLLKGEIMALEHDETTSKDHHDSTTAENTAEGKANEVDSNVDAANDDDRKSNAGQGVNDTLTIGESSMTDTHAAVEREAIVGRFCDERLNAIENNETLQKENEQDNASRTNLLPSMDAQLVAEAKGEVIVVNEESFSSDTLQNKAERGKGASEWKQVAACLDVPHVVATEVQSVVETRGEVTMETSSNGKRSSELLPEQPKETPGHTSKQHAARNHENAGVQIPNDNATIPTAPSPKKAKPASKKKKPSAATTKQRRSKSKTKPNDNSNEISTNNDMPANGGTTGANAVKQIRPRKRTRKTQACALCKTCPCQRTNTSTNDHCNLATLEIKDFSRSDGAIEKTLARRLQKLEQSTERLEEQTEFVRRRLKKHRREAWKRTKPRRGADANNERGKGGKVMGIGTDDSYFLPDAEVFEQQQTESKGLSRNVVEKAQTRVFPSVPTYQPTLFEVMGVSRDKEKTKQNNDVNVIDDKENNSKENIEISTNETSFLCLEENNSNEEVPTEYVPERDCSNRIHRLEWDNGASNDENEGMGATPGSIFDTILVMTQDQRCETNNKKRMEDNSRSIPLWDDLFESSHNRDLETVANDDAGLDDLLGLFRDEETYAAKDILRNVVSSAEGESRANPSLLSQGAQAVAEEVLSTYSSQEKKRIEMLELSCPNWKENVYFALMQKSSEDILDALKNVRESRMRMQAQRKRILDAWESKNAALQLFETALKRSAARLKQDDKSSTVASHDESRHTVADLSQSDCEAPMDNNSCPALSKGGDY